MNVTTARALELLGEASRAADGAITLLRSSLADTEPAPVSIVLLRTKAGTVHRAAQIDGIPGLLTYEADNLDEAELLHDLSALGDDQDLCQRCFGPPEPARDTD